MNHLFTLESDYYDTFNDDFYERISPEQFENGKLIWINKDYAKELSLSIAYLKHHQNVFLGNHEQAILHPVAQAYSGHQFGHYTRLGDGRAYLMGEAKDRQGRLVDIHLKGSGRTRFSRLGDGKGTFRSMLREMIISESMFHLHIPTSRPFLLLKTGEKVFREEILDGGILVRGAKSFFRFGTFEYARETMGKQGVKKLADYAIARLYPEVEKEKDLYFHFLKKIRHQLIKTVAQWMSIGFIHGVMNTDNMAVSGETIDYGPCAFMDYYDPFLVFSSIDTYGRYSYHNQPKILHWNFALFAGLFQDLIEDPNLLFQLIQSLPDAFEKERKNQFLKKIGFLDPSKANDDILKALYQVLEHHHPDFTNFFYHITVEDFSDPIFNTDQYKQFHQCLKSSNPDFGTLASKEIMQKKNPVIIPRNHIIESMLKEGDSNHWDVVMQWLELLKRPFDYHQKIPEKYQCPMDKEKVAKYKTYCGT